MHQSDYDHLTALEATNSKKIRINIGGTKTKADFLHIIRLLL